MRLKQIFLLTVVAGALLIAGPLHAADQHGLVVRSVADVRNERGPLSRSYDYDPKQETQLLYNEPVKIVARDGKWLKVEAIEQAEYTHNNRWEGYPGWVLQSEIAIGTAPKPNVVVQRKVTHLFRQPSDHSPFLPLSMGTTLAATTEIVHGYRKVHTATGGMAWVPDADLHPIQKSPPEEWARAKIIEAATQLIGDPYFWGGRSSHIPELKGKVTAPDCSALTNLAYRVAGITIPRDAMEQFMRAKIITRSALKKGDLIFSASKAKPEKIAHVAMYVDDHTLLEAPKTGELVRTISFQEKFGVPLKKIRAGKPTADRIISFGTYF